MQELYAEKILILEICTLILFYLILVSRVSMLNDPLRNINTAEYKAGTLVSLTKTVYI